MNALLAWALGVLGVLAVGGVLPTVRPAPRPRRRLWWPALAGTLLPPVLLAVAAWLAYDAAAATGDAVPLAVGVCAVVAVLAGGPFATSLLLLADPATRTPAPAPDAPPPRGAAAGIAPTPPASGAVAHSPAPATPPTGPGDPAVLRGGAWIGVMERLAVVGSVFTGAVEGVAIVLAVKGLGRYPELRSPAPGAGGSPDQYVAAERFIVGTFASVLWAAACAGVGLLLLD